MSENIRYKAFISYRHTDLDKKVAEKLQRKLEGYKPPKGILQDAGWKIFRDETELSTHSNLSEGILQALGRSEYLILICSESTKHSKWCMQEISHFKKLHNGSTDNIITLVTSGNPEEIFPDEILTTTVYDPQTGENKEKSVEPLAANISSDTEHAALKALDTEFLRIAAPLLRCSYDDLFLRDRRRRRRRITASVSAALTVAVLFSVYSVLTMMKISSQNADLEKKNQLLDSSNSSLRMAYNNLDNANLELERTNASLDLSNLTLKEKNDALDEANTELTDANKKLDDANTELTNTNKKLDDANTELTDTNKKLDDANTELTNTNKELDDANTEISNANKELDQKNAELTSTNKELDTAYTEISKTNKELEQKTKEAQENYEEAERLRQEAQKNYEEAEKQRQIAQENYEEAEKQRQIAQENLEKYQQKNAELRIANAEVVAAKADADLSNNYDRISAIEEVLAARPYEDDDTRLLPSATRFLHKALYSFTTVLEPRLDITLDAESNIKDFFFSPDNRYIVAYDVLNYVYVFDVDTGGIVYQELIESSILGVRFSDARHITIADSSRIRSVDFTDGSTVWELSKSTLGKIIDGVEFSDSGDRAAIWNDKVLYSIDVRSGEIRGTCNIPDGCSVFTVNDYADGVHFATQLRSMNYSFLTTFDTETSAVNVFSYMKTDNVIFQIKYVPGTGCGVLYKESGQDGYSVYQQFDENGNSLFTKPIYITTITDSEIKKPFTVEDTGETFVPITGIEAADERPAVYFINLDTQEVETLHMPSSAKQVGYRGTDGTLDGWVSVYTAKGKQYHYNLYTGESYMGHMTIDTDMSNADGSAKLVWVEGNTVAALGESTTKIMIYRSMYDESYTSAKHEGETVVRTTTISKDYVIGENSNTFFVYNKTDKSLIKTIHADYFVTNYAVYRDQLVSSDQTNGILYFYSLSSDEIRTADMHRFSKYNLSFWDIVVNKEEDILAAVSLTDIVIFDGNDVRYRSYSRRFDIGLNAPVIISPDGSKLILQSQSLNNTDLYYLDVVDTETLLMDNLITQNRIIYSMSYNYRPDNFVIDSDSRLTAFVYDKKVRIYDTESCALINEISLGARSSYSLMFEPDSDKLLIVTGDFTLMEYDVRSGDLLNSLALPNRVNPVDYGLRNMTEYNSKRNELILSNDSYACFISLDYFAVAAETSDEYTIYRGFVDDTQELIIQGKEELLFYPYYSPADLISKAEQLTAG